MIWKGRVSRRHIRLLIEAIHEHQVSERRDVCCEVKAPPHTPSLPPQLQSRAEGKVSDKLETIVTWSHFKVISHTVRVQSSVQAVPEKRERWKNKGWGTWILLAMAAFLLEVGASGLSLAKYFTDRPARAAQSPHTLIPCPSPHFRIRTESPELSVQQIHIRPQELLEQCNLCKEAKQEARKVSPQEELI